MLCVTQKNNSKTQTGCLRYSEDIDGPSTVKPNLSPRERTRVLSPGYSTETPKCPLVFELVNMGNYLQGNCIPDSTFSRTDSVSREHGHRTGIFFVGFFMRRQAFVRQLKAHMTRKSQLACPIRVVLLRGMTARVELVSPSRRTCLT